MDALLQSVERQVSLIRSGWMAVGKAWQDCAPQCEECRFNKVSGQEHPELISTCVLGQRGESPNQCPALQTQLADQAEETT